MYSLSISPVVCTLAYFIEKDYLHEDQDRISTVDVVVVLGGGILRRGVQSQQGPSNETSSRLLHGLQMLKRTGAEKFILSGAGSNYMTEARVMSTISRRLGVEKTRILIEPESRNTWEHAEELNRLIENKNSTVGIVTSALHMKRSIMVFRKYFSHIVPLPSKYIYAPKNLALSDFLPGTRSLYISSTIIHEIFGLLWYKIRALRT